ncbi:hypothetical protein [Bacillus sp. 7884-1]|uniref:hypothetical protein n=1 Tax=Bacillus sp. 7884-1 TaxID=2021693 RepID=UPI000BA6D3E5|nr:hypothetical protein [Bacillus sp. 7884-1]PAE31292.1 hypothetical protein CHI06_28685 [Bacillus sp. 7884-1]
MSVLIGVVLILVGLVSSITLSISVYKEYRKEKIKTSKALFLIVSVLEALSPSSISGFAFMLSLVAIVIGLALITGLFH